MSPCPRLHGRLVLICYMDSSLDYAKAFSACRRHRVDLNVFVIHNREAFVKNLQTFVEQVGDVDYINLFLTNLGYAVSIQRIDLVLTNLCDAARDRRRTMWSTKPATASAEGWRRRVCTSTSIRSSLLMS